MYKYADKVIKKLNLKFIRLFTKFKSQLHIDELNILSASKKLYEQLEESSEKAFLMIAKDTYKKYGDKNKQLDNDWVLDFLEEYDPVTKYVYLHEVERKQARFAESVIASRTKSKEVDTGLRYWANMVKQYGISITDAALLQAYKDVGIKYIKWITTMDDKECKICRERNGEIYPIDDIPPKPHIGCRCYYKAYKGDFDG